MQRAPATLHRLERGVHLAGLEQIRPQREHVARTLHPERRLGVAQVCLGARQDGDPAALRGEQLRRRAAHAPGAARHDSSRIAQAEIHAGRA